MTNATKENDNYGLQQAQAQLESIKEMVQLFESAKTLHSSEALEGAENRIQESPLCVELRSGWTSYGADFKAEEFKILLCTGGPAVQIVGELNDGQPENPRLQYQDWFTPWTDYRCASAETETLLIYCQQFYFGE